MGESEDSQYELAQKYLNAVKQPQKVIEYYTDDTERLESGLTDLLDDAQQAYNGDMTREEAVQAFAPAVNYLQEAEEKSHSETLEYVESLVDAAVEDGISIEQEETVYRPLLSKYETMAQEFRDEFGDVDVGMRAQRPTDRFPHGEDLENQLGQAERRISALRNIDRAEDKGEYRFKNASVADDKQKIRDEYRKTTEAAAKLDNMVGRILLLTDRFPNILETVGEESARGEQAPVRQPEWDANNIDGSAEDYTAFETDKEVEQFITNEIEGTERRDPEASIADN